jgi:hypothetical protein
MTLKIFIDRIVLDSGSFSPSPRRRLQAEIETELTNLLTINGIPNSLQLGGSIPNLSISLRNLPSTMYSAQLGQIIALSIYNEMPHWLPSNYSLKS